MANGSTTQLQPSYNASNGSLVGRSQSLLFLSVPRTRTLTLNIFHANFCRDHLRNVPQGRRKIGRTDHWDDIRWVGAWRQCLPLQSPMRVGHRELRACENCGAAISVNLAFLCRTLGLKDLHFMCG